jgi:hypothetical protein
MPSERSSIAETQLAAAVIRRALDDALTPTGRLARTEAPDTPDCSPQGIGTTVTAPEREEAVRFLLDTSQRWSQSRTVWCDAAGLDPDVLVGHALRRIPLAAIPNDIRLARRLGAAAAPMREAA